jgi:hypothetical protein
MKGDVERYIRKSDKCQRNKMKQLHTRMPLLITDTPTTVFEKCSIDVIGSLSPSLSQNRYILTIQDEYQNF